MIEIKNLKQETPFIIFKDKYNKALKAGQKNIEALNVSSFNAFTNEVDSRYVNLKIIDKNEFIFFTNYDSPKAVAFKSHNQISACFYWSNIDLQIRMKAKIQKTSKIFNKRYFKNRDIKKNALAISSSQSKPISSYNEIKEKYINVKKNFDLLECPNFWGGYSFIPYYFEFWEGHKSRINKREVFDMVDGIWEHSFLQP